jgi:hypothetical protein
VEKRETTCRVNERRSNLSAKQFPDRDPPDPHVFGPPGSGAISQRYRSGSFYHHALRLLRIRPRSGSVILPARLWIFLKLKENIILIVHYRTVWTASTCSRIL